MPEKQLSELLDKILPVDTSSKDTIQAHLDNLTKPRGSLGRLEEFAARFCMITGSLRPSIPEKAVLVFAGDHGVTEEGISAFPKEVTFQMVHNFLVGGAGINVLARHVGADVKVLDIGVDHDFEPVEGLVDIKVAHGTDNFTKGPAMTREQAVSAILAGAVQAKAVIDKGAGMLATGEMGIGNTTPASAITAVMCERDPEDVTGRGTGIDESAWRHKVDVIRRGIECNRPDPGDPLDVLSKVGGYEIAGICGLVLACAAENVPVVTDGFISTAGALVATALKPEARGYIFAAHQSVEQGHMAQLEYLKQRPILDLDMRLGEGTGAVLAMNLIEAGLKIYLEMATFDGAQVTPGSEAV